MIVTESAALGTPAIVYDVDGLRDTVVDGKTGFICSDNTPSCISEKMEAILSDEHLRDSFSSAAIEHSKQYTWERSAREFLEVISK